MQVHRIDLAHGTYALGDNKTDDPRGWMLSPDVTRALKLWMEKFHPDPRPDALLFVDPGTGLSPINDNGCLARDFRRHLRQAGVTRAELFEKSDLRRPIRAHDLRATFITLALARGKSEQWVMDRTGHTTSGMLQRYRRASRTVAEAKMTTLSPLDTIPELAAVAEKAGRSKEDRDDPPESPSGGNLGDQSVKSTSEKRS
jgi:integrase